MRDDLISRQAAISVTWNAHNTGDACRELRALPSSQSERKKGEWIVDALANNIYRCSECGIDAPAEPTGGTEYKSNYCPHCGAKMEVKK